MAKSKLQSAAEAAVQRFDELGEASANRAVSAKARQAFYQSMVALKKALGQPAQKPAKSAKR